MKIGTTRFGSLDVDESALVTFPAGLVGLGELRRFAVFDGPAGTPFKWLQSAERPELAYVICDPALFARGYRIAVTAEDLSPIAVRQVSDAVVSVILSIPDDWRLMTANMAGPLVFNVPRRLGMQLVLSDAAWSVRHMVFREAR
jgi:flagellar assembly factor FliW